MFAKDFKPWWEKVNDFYLFEEREEFMRGAVGFRPNNRQEAMIAQIMAGYVNQKHKQPKSLGKKQ